MTDDEKRAMLAAIEALRAQLGSEPNFKAEWIG